MIVKKIGFKRQTVGSLLTHLADDDFSYTSLGPITSNYFVTLMTALFPTTNTTYAKIPFSYLLVDNVVEDVPIVMATLLFKLRRLSEEREVIEEFVNPKVDLSYLIKAYVADQIDNFQVSGTDFPEDGKVFAGSALIPVLSRFISHVNMCIVQVQHMVTQVIEYFSLELWKQQQFKMNDDNVMVDYWKRNLNMVPQVLPNSNTDKGEGYYKTFLSHSSIVKVTPQQYFTEKTYEHLGVKAAKLITRPESPTLFKTFTFNPVRKGFGEYRILDVREPWRSIIQEGIFDNKYEDHSSITSAVATMQVEGSLFTGVVHFHNKKNVGMSSQLKLCVYELSPFKVELENGSPMTFIFEAVEVNYPFRVRKVPTEKDVLFNTKFEGSKVIVEKLSFDELVNKQYTKVMFAKTTEKEVGEITFDHPSFSQPDTFTPESITVPLQKLLCGEKWPVLSTKSIVASYKSVTVEKEYELYHQFKPLAVEISKMVQTECNSFNRKQYFSRIEFQRNQLSVTMAILDEVIYKIFGHRFLLRIFKNIYKV